MISHTPRVPAAHPARYALRVSDFWRTSSRIVALALLSVMVFLLSTGPANAKKTHLLLETFGSAAQPSLQSANGLTVDQVTGDLLVIDPAKQTVSRYKADGEPDPFTALGTNVIDAGRGAGGKPCAEEPSSCDQTPHNSFEFGSEPGEAQIAVDESGTATNGDIYITQGNQRLGNLVDIFSASGEYLGNLTAAGPAGFGTVGGFPFSPCGAAVNSAGGLFLGGGFDDEIYKFVSRGSPHNPLVNSDFSEALPVGETTCNLAAGAGATEGSLFANTFFTQKGNSVLKFSESGGALEGIVDPSENRLVTLDPSDGHLYVANQNVTNGTVNEYDASGPNSSLLSSVSVGVVPTGLAVAAASGRIYVANNEPTIRVYSPLVTVPDVTTGSAAITGDTSVSVEGTVNPDGVALEECRFEYGQTEAPYEHSEPCAESPAEIGTSTKSVHLGLGGLTPEVVYHYRLVAKNANATIDGADQTFQTPAKPEIGAWSVGVGATEATLKATINPENAESTYWIEWGPTITYSHSTSAKVLATGRDAENHAVSFALEGLTPGTTYHYRVVAANAIGTTEGADRILTTFPLLGEPEVGCANDSFRTGASAALPDCRAYEMVSPLEKNNADIHTLSNFAVHPTSLDQSSTDGSGFTYSSDSAFADPKSGPYTVQALSSRRERGGGAGEGWSSESIDPAGKPAADNVTTEFLENPYKAFTQDLSSGWLTWYSSASEQTPAPCAPVGFTNVYRRESADGAFQSLSCSPVERSQVRYYLPEIQGFSTDGSRSVFRADEALVKGASSATTLNPPRVEPIYQLYESAPNGQVSLVSVLPNGQASSLDSSAGTSGENDPVGYWEYNRLGSLVHAVSDDATRVFWSTGGRSGPIYLRVNVGQRQSKIAAGKCTQPARACTLGVSGTVTTEPSFFQAGNPQGTKALFTVREGPLAGNLYEFDASSEPAVSHLIAEKTFGSSILGASEDLARVYFLSEQALPQEQSEGAVQGEPNLYLAEEGRIGFVATLSEEAEISDVSNLYGTAEGSPIHRVARISPDGSLVFMSNSLALSERTADYDNTDSNSGRPDAEIYLYDPTADGGKGKLHCLSCNPSGARPLGRELATDSEGRPGYWGAARVPPFENELYQPRYVSDGGKRVFFDSYDALVLGDTNGKEDVYEWEAAGTGSCTTGNLSYVVATEGCLHLISSGRSPDDSEFLDASASGSDVFFSTAEGLLPQDYGLIDIYDARVGGGFPPPAGPAAGCEGETCQGAPVPPLDTTPSSLVFAGPGNPLPPTATSKAKAKPKPKSCGKGKLRQKGKCVKKRAVKKRSIRKGKGKSSRRGAKRNGRKSR